MFSAGAAATALCCTKTIKVAISPVEEISPEDIKNLKDAFDDEHVARQQLENLQPVDQDSTDTIGMNDAAKHMAWIKSARRGLAVFTLFENQREVCHGSAVLIDNRGTVVFCAHEITLGLSKDHGAMSVVLDFYPTPTDARITTPAYDICWDSNHDIAFASINYNQISVYDGSSDLKELIPVKLGRYGFDLENIKTSIVAMGWPAPQNHLHVTQGIATEYLPTISGLKLAKTDCVISGKIAVFKGMSGGAVFNSFGDLLGVINSTTSLGINATSQFTPVDLIRKAYGELYPDRAEASGIVLTDQPHPPEECWVDKNNFTTLKPKS